MDEKLIVMLLFIGTMFGFMITDIIRTIRYNKKVKEVDVDKLLKDHEDDFIITHGRPRSDEVRVWNVDTRKLEKHESEALIQHMIKQYKKKDI
jgi:hypothetical protein